MTHDDGTVERELLREALSALDEMVEWFSPPTDRGLHEGEREALKQARAAADKIRAALNHQQKGEEL